jgi:hypothetical protein
MCWRKDSLFNKWCWENWISTCRRLKLDPYLTFSIKINSRWIKDPNIRPKTLNLLEENTGKILQAVATGSKCLNRISIAPEIVARIHKWNCIKLKRYCTAKETIIRLKRLTTEWEKIFARYSCNRGLISRIHKEFKKLNTERIIYNIKLSQQIPPVP